uniref:Uncharacterized protein n=1 Tax=Opuntia streptacantha TaxID=393608 RepID=A0A7C9ACR6_OPUST
MIGDPVPKPKIRAIGPELIQHRLPLLITNQNARPGDETGGPSGLRVDLNVGTQDLIRTQVILYKGLHHNNRVSRYDHLLPPLTPIKHLPTIPPDIGGVEPGQHGPGCELDVPGLEAREGDKDHGLYG